MKQIIMIALTAVILLTGCNGFGPTDVEYRVQCSSGYANVTLSNKDGGIEQYTVGS